MQGKAREHVFNKYYKENAPVVFNPRDFRGVDTDEKIQLHLSVINQALRSQGKPVGEFTRQSDGTWVMNMEGAPATPASIVKITEDDIENHEANRRARLEKDADAARRAGQPASSKTAAPKAAKQEESKINTEDIRFAINLISKRPDAGKIFSMTDPDDDAIVSEFEEKTKKLEKLGSAEKLISEYEKQRYDEALHRKNGFVRYLWENLGIQQEAADKIYKEFADYRRKKKATETADDMLGVINQEILKGRENEKKAAEEAERAQQAHEATTQAGKDLSETPVTQKSAVQQEAETAERTQAVASAKDNLVAMRKSYAKILVESGDKNVPNDLYINAVNTYREALKANGVNSSELLKETVLGEAIALYDTKTQYRVENRANPLHFREGLNKLATFGNWYRTLPFKTKIGISAALMTGGIVAGAFGGVGLVGTILAGTVSTGYGISRFLGGLSTTLGTESMIKASQERAAETEVFKKFEALKETLNNSDLNAKLLELAERKRSEKIRRYVMAGTMGTLVGSGATAMALKELWNADFMEVAKTSWKNWLGFGTAVPNSTINHLSKGIAPERVRESLRVGGAAETIIPQNYIETAKPGDSLWKMVERQIDLHMSKDFDPARKTHLVDAIKDRIAANPHQFGFDDIDTLKAGQKVDFSKIFSDSAFLAETVQKGLKLTPEQLQNILHNNTTIREWTLQHPGTRITSELVDKILKGTADVAPAEIADNTHILPEEVIPQSEIEPEGGVHFESSEARDAATDAVRSELERYEYDPRVVDRFNDKIEGFVKDGSYESLGPIDIEIVESRSVLGVNAEILKSAGFSEKTIETIADADLRTLHKINVDHLLETTGKLKATGLVSQERIDAYLQEAAYTESLQNIDERMALIGRHLDLLQKAKVPNETILKMSLDEVLTLNMPKIKDIIDGTAGVGHRVDSPLLGDAVKKLGYVEESMLDKIVSHYVKRGYDPHDVIDMIRKNPGYVEDMTHLVNEDLVKIMNDPRLADQGLAKIVNNPQLGFELLEENLRTTGEAAQQAAKAAIEIPADASVPKQISIMIGLPEKVVSELNAETLAKISNEQLKGLASPMKDLGIAEWNPGSRHNFLAQLTEKIIQKDAAYIDRFMSVYRNALYEKFNGTGSPSPATIEKTIEATRKALLSSK